MNWGVPWGGHPGLLRAGISQEKVVCSKQQCVSDRKVRAVGVLHFRNCCREERLLEEGLQDAGMPKEIVVCSSSSSSRYCVSDTWVLPVSVSHLEQKLQGRAVGDKIE